MPERFKNQYDEIEHPDASIPDPREARHRAARDWGVEILSAVVLLLIAALVFVVVPTFNRMTTAMNDVTDGQQEAKVRGCILLATSTNGFLPSSCLTENPLTIYSGDVIDSLPSDSPNRFIICRALDRMGRADSDC